MAADYSMTAELLASHNIPRTVSEIHGVLCGQTCGGTPHYDLDLSLKLLEMDSTEEVITDLLNLLAEDIRTQFQAEDFAFHPLLPDDDTPLVERLAALAQWCDSFNAGFAGAWVLDDAAMAAETREVLEDFSRIAQVDQEDEEAPDRENEENYMQLVEYTRMAAITVYLQNAPRKPADPPGDDAIH